MCCKSHAIEFSCQAFCLPTEPSHLVSHVSAVRCVSYSSEWGWGWYKGYQKKQYFFFSPSSNDYGSLWGECHTSAIYITVFQKQCCLWLCNYLINTQYSLHFNLFYFISKYGQAAHVLSTYYIYIGIGVYVCLSVTRYFSTEMPNVLYVWVNRHSVAIIQYSLSTREHWNVFFHCTMCFTVYYISWS